MKTILVVDDSPTIRALIRRIVESLGFEVREAGDGLEALAVLERERESEGPIDGVILDVEMPRMDGLSFLKALRSRPDVAQPPVVVCTTRCSPDSIETALDSGADEYVMKPFDGDILSSKLRRVGLVA